MTHHRYQSLTQKNLYVVNSLNKQLNKLKKVLKRQELYIIQADKLNLLTLISKQDYQDEATKQLGDTSTYEPLTAQGLKIIMDRTERTINS